MSNSAIADRCLQATLILALGSVIACSSPSQKPSEPMSSLISMGRLAQGDAGPFSLDRVPQPSPNMLDTGSGFRSFDVKRDADVDVPYLSEDPISQVRYHVAAEPTETRAIRRALLGVTLWIRDSVDEDLALAELAAVGVSPTGIYGVLGALPLPGSSVGPRGVVADPEIDPELTLLFATTLPETWLGFRNGQLTLLLRRNAPGFWERQPGWMPIEDFTRWLDEVPRLETPPATIVTLLGLAQQALPGVQLAELDELASRAAGVQGTRREECLQSLARIQPDWDQRFASASLVDGLTLLIEQTETVELLRDLKGELIEESVDWRSRSHETWLAKLRETFGQEQTSRVGHKMINGASYGLKSLRNKGRSPGLPGFMPVLSWTIEYYKLRDDDPLRQAQRRFAYLRSADADEQSPGRELVNGATVDLSDAMRIIAEDYDQDDFIEDWAAGLQGSLWSAVDPDRRDRTAGVIETMFRVYDSLTVPPTTWAAERERLANLAPWYTRLADNGDATIVRPVSHLANDCAQHLRALLPMLDDHSEKLMTRGLIEALQWDGDLSAVASIPEIEDVVRAFEDTGSLRERLDRIDALAARHVSLGSLAWTVARELGHPLAREFAAQADALEDQPAMAAAGFFDAATVGNPQCPEGVSSRQLSYALSGWAYGSIDDPASERQRWLEQSRRLALKAVGQSLPKVASKDPARPLMNRFVGRQLGGNLNLATRIGVRLSGLHDVAGFPGEPEHWLRLVDGEPRWVADPNRGEAVGLESLSVDETSWSRLSKLGDELEVARTDLEVARSALSLDLPSLAERQEQTTAKLVELQRQVSAGELAGDQVKGALTRLRRESASLDSAIRNYTSRNRHLQGTIDGFNEKVGEYNNLLFQLNGELAQAWKRWTGPATESATAAWLDRASLTAQERSARRWLLGHAGVSSPLRVTRPTNGVDVSLALRHATDSARGARILLIAFEERRQDERLHPREALGQHVLALFPALLAYMETYGSESLVQNILHGPLKTNVALEDLIISHMWRHPEWDNQRKSLKRALGR